MNEGEGAGMDKGWSWVRAHWTPAAPVGKVRVRAQAAGAQEREEGHGFVPPPGLQLLG